MHDIYLFDEKLILSRYLYIKSLRKMDLDCEKTTDEYFVTALQIFDYCGAESSGTLRVDALMDKFAPFVKTNKSEYSFLKSLLDPEQENPEINTTKLAKALHKYSESQKSKVDLEESFNLKSGQAPQDSDSGISTDGYQLLEELQSELREKAHLALQLRNQLDFTDRQHEEALATLSAERDSLRAHLNMLREENMTLTHVRRDYEEACDRLCASDLALAEARRDLEGVRRRARLLQEQLSTLETDKLTLQELLTKSKDECHRINEMYASRQSALLEENETLKTEHADLTSRHQDHEEFMQQMIKEKVLLEMELKDVLNKSNQTHLRLDRSIDVSYCDDPALSALDSLNADTRFTQEHRLLDEESFVNALKEDQGRATNMSLFDEIRLSFSNMSRHNITTATEFNSTQCNKCQNTDISVNTIETQTDEEYNDNRSYIDCDSLQNKMGRIDNLNTISTQTDEIELYAHNNNVHDRAKCLECENSNNYTAKLEMDVRYSRRTLAEMQSELIKYEDNLNILQRFVNEGNDRNHVLQSHVDGLLSKIGILEEACAKQRIMIEELTSDTCCAQCQTESDQSSVATQVEVPCSDCEKRVAAPHRSLRKFFWEPLKCLFQLFAIICFVCAVCALYGVTRRTHTHAECARALPWRWLHAQDLVDLLFRIEYVSDVPM